MAGDDPRRAADAVRALGESHRLLFLFDFDGTLCEFNPDPSAVKLSDTRRRLLLATAANLVAALGVVSGRRVDDVRLRTGLPAFVYFAGLHGLEIEGPGGRFVHPEIESGVELLAGLKDTLERDVRGIPGVFIENKIAALVAHYRAASEADSKRVTELVLTRADPLLDAGKLRVMHGACMLELLPNIPWNKGNAVEWIRGRVDSQGNDVACVYIGDDVTDEDAFRIVRGRGLAIAASPRPRGADLVIDGPAEVERFLEQLIG